jgi:hypothetical protein
MSLDGLKSISEKTLVPITVSIAAMCFGWWWRDREATKAEQERVSLTSELKSEVAASTAQILAKIDLVTERYAMLDKSRGEQTDQSFLALFELNATLNRPYKYK